MWQDVWHDVVVCVWQDVWHDVVVCVWQDVWQDVVVCACGRMCGRMWWWCVAGCGGVWQDVWQDSLCWCVGRMCGGGVCPMCSKPKWFGMADGGEAGSRKYLGKDRHPPLGRLAVAMHAGKETNRPPTTRQAGSSHPPTITEQQHAGHRPGD